MPKIVDYPVRRREIASCAVSIFVREGYLQANLSMIAELCGFGRTTIYKYFRSKEEIFAFVIDELFSRLERESAAIVSDKSLPAVERLSRLLEVLVRAAIEDRDRMLLLLDVLLHPNGGEGRFVGETRRRVEALRGFLERLVAEGVADGSFEPTDPGPLAHALFSLVEAYVLQNSYHGPVSLDSAMKATRLLLGGLERRGVAAESRA